LSNALTCDKNSSHDVNVQRQQKNWQFLFRLVSRVICVLFRQSRLIVYAPRMQTRHVLIGCIIVSVDIVLKSFEHTQPVTLQSFTNFQENVHLVWSVIFPRFSLFNFLGCVHST